MSFKSAILKGADAIDARKTFDPKERAQYLNGSEAMTCIRKQWYIKNEAKEDGPQDWGYARRGMHAEDYMVSRLQAANIPLLFTGKDQVGIRDDELHISCTPDGLAGAQAMGHKEAGWIGAEFKSMDPRTNRDYLPKPEHVVQLQIGMAMLEKFRDEFPEMGADPILHGTLVYIDASNFNDIEEFHVKLAPKILDRIAPRAKRVLNATSAARLPREGVETRNKSECKQRCAFNKVCGVDGASTTTGQGKVGAASLRTQITDYLLGKKTEATGKAQKDAAGEQIKSILQKNPHAVVDGHQVKLSSKAGSVSYATVVKEHLPNLDLEPYRGNSSETLTVK
jgi:hypothetical protein